MIKPKPEYTPRPHFRAVQWWGGHWKVQYREWSPNPGVWYWCDICDVDNGSWNSNEEMAKWLADVLECEKEYIRGLGNVPGFVRPGPFTVEDLTTIAPGASPGSIPGTGEGDTPPGQAPGPTSGQGPTCAGAGGVV